MRLSISVPTDHHFVGAVTDAPEHVVIHAQGHAGTQYRQPRIDLPAQFDTRLLHTAAGQGRGEATRLLLEYGAEVDAAGDDGETPLLLAVRSQCVDCAEALLAHDAALGAWAYEYAAAATGPQERVITRALIAGGLDPDYGLLAQAVLDDQPEHLAFVFAPADHTSFPYGQLRRPARLSRARAQTPSGFTRDALARRRTQL